MTMLREIAKKIPLLPSLYRVLFRTRPPGRPVPKAPEDIFTEFYETNAWHGRDSASGTGSDVHQTRVIIKELRPLLDDLNAATMLDIPCGDFHWMQRVDLGGIDYTGADIVKELIQRNTEKYGKDGVRFRVLNLIQDSLPPADVIFCRDCLVHLSFADIFLALDNVCRSRSRYLLTTTFTGRKDNRDVATGDWRVLNLERPPFAFPSPLRVIHEACTEDDGIYEDKALGLWRIEDIRKHLPTSPDYSHRYDVARGSGG